MKRLFFPFAAVLALTGCLRNDLDYPVVFGGFTSFEVEGAREVTIDNARRMVSIDLEEGTDKDHVKVVSYALTDKAVLSRDIPEYLDLTGTFDVTLNTYQSYDWQVVGTQNIVRYVECEKQVGEAAINENTHFVVLSVTDDQPLDKIVFTAMKLGPEGSVIKSTTGYEVGSAGSSVVSREIKGFPVTLDCVMERSFDVEFKGRLTSWKVKTVQITVESEVRSVQPWCHKAEIRAVCSGKNSDAALEYKKAAATVWNVVPDTKLAGVGLSATLTGLDADTDYLLRVVDGGTLSEEYPFHTYAEVQVYNMNFDAWHLEGKIWYPYPENPTPAQLVWDTANKATASFASSITTPDENFVYAPGAGKKSARMESVYAVVQFAGGNLFIGQFVKLQGLGVELQHGTPFATRPTALHGYYAFSPATVTYADADHQDMLGKEDVAQLQVVLADWDDKYHVYSAKKQFIDFADPHIIGSFNEMLSGTGGEWKEFTIPIAYRDNRTPKWVVIISASSYYANFYTGGVGSTLWLDELDFVYE